MSDNNEALAEQLATKHYKAMCAKELGHLSTIDTIASAVREALNSRPAEPSVELEAYIADRLAKALKERNYALVPVAELQAKAVPDGWKLVPMKATDWRQQHDAAFNLCGEFGDEFTRSNRDFALRTYEWLVKFSPAAPAPAASPVAASTVVRTAPERIWLQVSTSSSDCSRPFPEADQGMTWCDSSVLPCEVPYIRADIAAASPAVPVGWLAGSKEPEEGLYVAIYKGLWSYPVALICFDDANGWHEQIEDGEDGYNEGREVVLYLPVNFDNTGLQSVRDKIGVHPAARQAPALPASGLSGSECGNCFEGKSDLDHECQKCGGTGEVK